MCTCRPLIVPNLFRRCLHLGQVERLLRISQVVAILSTAFEAKSIPTPVARVQHGGREEGHAGAAARGRQQLGLRRLSHLPVPGRCRRHDACRDRAGELRPDTAALPARCPWSSKSRTATPSGSLC